MATASQNWMQICNGLKDGAATQQQAEAVAQALVNRDWLRIIAETPISNPANMTGNQMAKWAIKVTKEYFRSIMELTDTTVTTAQDDVVAAIEAAKAAALSAWPDEEIT